MTDATAPGATTDLATLPPAEAAAKLDALVADKKWSANLLAGNGPERRQMDALISAKTKADKIEAALAGTLQPQAFETVTGGELTSRNLALGVKELKDSGVEVKQIERLLKNEPISAEDRELVLRQEKQLLGDAAFVKRYLSGDFNAGALMTTIALHKIRPVKTENA